MQNDITRGTKNSHIGAVNAKNYLSQTIGNYMTDQTKLQHKSIQSQNVLVRDRNGKYRQATPQEVQDPNKIKYKNTQWKTYNQYSTQAADVNNKKVELHKAAITSTAGKGFKNQELQTNINLQRLALQDKIA